LDTGSDWSAEMKINDIESIKKLLNYNPSTGVFTWRVNRKGKVKQGDVAGTMTNNGYISITANMQRCLAHRLAFMFVYGRVPFEIDHINHDKTDNRLENLREVRRSDNNKNLSLPSHNKSGVIGVCWLNKRKSWLAFIHVDNKMVSLGETKCFDKAVEKRKQAEIYYGFHENHGQENQNANYLIPHSKHQNQHRIHQWPSAHC